MTLVRTSCATSNSIPALPLETNYLWTASDPSYAAANGDDLLPDIAIGRLPAADESELRVIIEKISRSPFGDPALLLR